MIRKLIICIAVLVGFCPMAWGTVDDVPNPKTYDADNWVSDPDHILDSETKNKINDILQQLEDSLTIEVAVVALNSIGEEEPHEFAVTLFNRWGVGKAEDDNGLLILLTRDIRDITFKTGYGLEGVLPDAICKRIQLETMVPHLRERRPAASRSTSGRFRPSPRHRNRLQPFSLRLDADRYSGKTARMAKASTVRRDWRFRF